MNSLRNCSRLLIRNCFHSSISFSFFHLARITCIFLLCDSIFLTAVSCVFFLFIYFPCGHSFFFLSSFPFVSSNAPSSSLIHPFFLPLYLSSLTSSLSCCLLDVPFTASHPPPRPHLPFAPPSFPFSSFPSFPPRRAVPDPRWLGPPLCPNNNIKVTASFTREDSDPGQSFVHTRPPGSL